MWVAEPAGRGRSLRAAAAAATRSLSRVGIARAFALPQQDDRSSQGGVCRRGRDMAAADGKPGRDPGLAG
jgi:hypothetical protein